MSCDVCNGTGVVWALFAGMTEDAVPCAACRAPAKPVADLLANLGTPDHIVEHTMAMASRCDCACGCKATTVHGTCNLCKDGAHAP